MLLEIALGAGALLGISRLLPKGNKVVETPPPSGSTTSPSGGGSWQPTPQPSAAAPPTSTVTTTTGGEYVWMDTPSRRFWARGSIYARRNGFDIEEPSIEVDENTYLGMGKELHGGNVVVYRTINGNRYRFYLPSGHTTRAATRAEYEKIQDDWGKTMAPQVAQWITQNCEIA